MKVLKVFKSEQDALTAFEECAVKLEKLRDKTGLKQQELVRSCDFNQPTYSLFVARSPMYIGENTLLRVCADCRVKVNGEYLPFNERLERPLINGKTFMWWMISFTTPDQITPVQERVSLGQLTNRTFSFADAIKVVEHIDTSVIKEEKIESKQEEKPVDKTEDILDRPMTNAELCAEIIALKEQMNIRLGHIEKMIQKLYPAGLK
jgi:hypothetical protein